jgi:hypothetical protein
MATRWPVTIDCAEPATLARFWVLAPGYRLEPPPAGFATCQEWCVQHGMPEEEADEGASIVDPDGVGGRIFRAVAAGGRPDDVGRGRTWDKPHEWPRESHAS